MPEITEDLRQAVKSYKDELELPIRSKVCTTEQLVHVVERLCGFAVDSIREHDECEAFLVPVKDTEDYKEGERLLRKSYEILVEQEKYRQHEHAEGQLPVDTEWLESVGFEYGPEISHLYDCKMYINNNGSQGIYAVIFDGDVELGFIDLLGRRYPLKGEDDEDDCFVVRQDVTDLLRIGGGGE